MTTTTPTRTGDEPQLGADARPHFNPFEEGFFDDPYSQYTRMREFAPVHANPLGGLLCFGYEAVRRLLREPRTSMAGARSLEHPIFPSGLINLDPPDHTRVRRLMSRVFTPRRIADLGPWIEAEVVRSLDAIEAEHRETGGPVDLITGLAFPLPFKVISGLLGMPEADADQIRAWTQDITSVTPQVDMAELARAQAAYKALSDYVSTEVIPWKRAEPRDDLLSALLAAEDEGGRLSHAELIDQVTLLYAAGHETTTGLIGNGILSLLRNRSQLERLQADPTLLANAVEELNRFESPIQFTWRYALEDLTVEAATLETGQMALLCLGAANRDPAHFGPSAGELDVARADASELVSFGAGIHFCLGAALARQEAYHALGRLITRFPSLELAGDPVWNPRITFRALRQLPVALT